MTTAPDLDDTTAAGSSPADTTIAATIQPAPAAGDSFAAARSNAIAHHVKTLRHAIGALRGMGEHDLVAALMAGEIEDTVTEARLIATRKAKGRPRACLSPVRAKTPAEVN